MRRLALLVCTLSMVAIACSDDAPTSVRLLTHDSFVIGDETREAFESTTGLTLEIIRSSDAGAMTTQAVLISGNPVADVIFGVDTTFLSRALEGDLFEAYRPDRTASVAPDLLRDDDLVTPVTFGDVCLNIDTAAFESGSAPTTLLDLVDPALSGMLVVQNPATSSPGLAFLLATIATFGETGEYTWMDYWADLRTNDVAVTPGWEEAYFGSFTVGGGGDRPIVVSYASSPPAEVLFADPPIETARSAVMTDGCFRQVEYAGILRGTDRRPAAEALVDFLLSTTFQTEVPLTMFVFPVVDDAPLPQVFIDHTEIPTRTATITAADIERRREEWIETWTSIVLR